MGAIWRDGELIDGPMARAALERWRWLRCATAPTHPPVHLRGVAPAMNVITASPSAHTR